MNRIAIFRLLAVALFTTFMLAGQAQACDKNNSTKAMKASNTSYEEASFVTSAHCGSCKSTIEGGLLKTAGVMESDLNLDNKVVTVKYNPDEISANKIQKEIVKLGYKADVVKSDKDGCSSVKSASKAASECCSKSKTTKTANK